MRRLVLALALTLAASLRAESIPPPPPEPQAFFGVEGIAFARFSEQYDFVVERVVRGPVKAGDRVAYNYQSGLDSPPQPVPGTLYLISRFCWQQRCEAAWTDEREAPRLLAWLERSHRESHATLLARTIDWAEGRVKLAEYREWLGTVVLDPIDDDDGLFLEELLDALQNLTGELQPEANVRNAMREFVKLARAFPRGVNDDEEREVALLDALAAATSRLAPPPLSD